jgi:sporulation protein YlmC with PRC-barrel domain
MKGSKIATLTIAGAALLAAAAPVAAQQAPPSSAPPPSAPGPAQPTDSGQPSSSGQPTGSGQPASASQPAPPNPSASGTQAAAQAAVQVDTSALVGSQVRTSDGRELGTVDRLMMDPKQGQITTVVIKRGGTLGMGGETFAVPWSAVRVGQDDRKLVVTVDQQLLDRAPAASPRTDEGRGKNDERKNRDDRKNEGAQPPRR